MSTIHNSSNVSHPASSSYIPPSVGNQTNRSSYCSTAVSVSDTATSRSSMSAADVSDQANNYFRTTCKTLKALRVESYEMTAHIMPIVSADEHPDYLQVIGEDADHLHTIDDNFSTINDEPGYSELDDVESSYNELESQQDNSRSHIEDGSTCQDNAGDEPAYQVVNDDSDYEQILYNEQNQAQVTNTSEQPLDITADLDKPQTNWKCIAIMVLTFISVTMLSAGIGLGLFYYHALYSSNNIASNNLKMNTAQFVDAFGVSATELPSDIGVVISFNDAIRNVNDSNFDTTSNSLNVPASNSNYSLYWMHIGLYKRSLNESYDSPLFVIKHSSEIILIIRVSKSFVVSLKAYSIVSINTNSIKLNTRVIAVYWSSFQLNDLMHPLVVVHVTCYNYAEIKNDKPKQNTIKQLSKIFYNTVLINEGQAWDKRNSLFTVRHSGIYVFSIRTIFPVFSNNNNKLANGLLKSNGTLNTVVLLHIGRTNSTIAKQELPVAQLSTLSQLYKPVPHTVSASCLVNLFESDTAEVWLRKEHSWHPDILETAVSAFYYSPVSNTQVVWSVATVPASDWAVDLTAEGSLQYKTVTINIGGVWSHTRNAAIITVPGIYYTVANIDISCSHIIATFWLKVNGENVFEIQPSSRIDSGQTRNNGAVIRLDEGDNVNVVLWLPLSASCYYINSDASASFFGLLLSPYIYA